VFGRVASDPTVSKLIDALALTPATALVAVNKARAAVGQRVWKLAGQGAPDISADRDRIPVIIRAERPHPGAQLRSTDVRRQPADRVRHQHFDRQLADLELRHRRRARCEDRIRAAKDTGLTNLP